MTATTLTIAVLNCGYTVPSVQKARGQYHDVFAAILQPAVDRHNAGTDDKVTLQVLGFDTVKEEYPESLDGIHAVIISGSPNGAYEQLPWIRRLLTYVTEIKLYGSCFGHQVICEALYCDCGIVVRKDPAGYELGVHTVELEKDFVDRFQEYLGERTLRLQFLHGDHVLLPEGVSQLPRGVSVVGTTPHCNVQGIYEAGRILTFQGHPEFDTFINTECLRLVGQRVGWEEMYTEAAVVAAQADDDAATALTLHEISVKLDQLESHSHGASQILRAFWRHLDQDGKQALMDDISACQDSNERLVELASHLLDAILKPFKLAGGKAPTPVTTPPSLDAEREISLATATIEATTRNDQSSLRSDCLRRDGYRCVYTGAWDIPSCEQQLANPTPDAEGTYVDCAHILPFALGFFDETDALQTRNKSIIWFAIHRYFPALAGKIDARSINQPANAIMINTLCHRHFGEYGLTFEPQGNNEYRIINHSNLRQLLQLKSGSSQLQLTCADDTIPMPDPEIFRVHFIIARVLQVSGFGDRISKAAEKAYLDLDCHILEASGSTDVGGLLSRMLLTSVRVDSEDKTGENHATEISLRPGTG
ncbi:hypothetical protein F503_07120 [Ophiostoma piceae UAMH 11346]|uniref:Uncharacterized protein n=1 Tax=Ophiostoma piceae (strain UAMH 11346) TaxID=1262450 RepID=S3C733_OPHP1|nr:hypothetical protein F503_07120 [Ophiostoma piceae UAMH 11346]